MKLHFKSIFNIVIGNMLLAISIVYFVLPRGILSGGVAGIAVIFNKLFNFNEVVCIDIVVALTFILGYFVLGKVFALKTLLSSLLYPAFVSILSNIKFDIKADSFLMAIYGAVIAGIGIALVIKEDASTGGTDVFALTLHRFTSLSIGTCMAIFDGLITVAGLLVYGIEDVMIGLIYIYLSNYIIDKMVMPNNDAVKLLIISEKIEDICKYIHDVLERGTTILLGKGGYTKKEKEIILTVVSKQQYTLLDNKIQEIDPTAFVIASEATDIKGEGFSYRV